MKKRIVCLLAALLLCACSKIPDPTVPSDQPEQTENQTTIQMEDHSGESEPPVTGPDTETTTEPATEPETEAVTEPETEAPTEPAAEPEDTAFVNVVDYLPHARVELAYATEDNFTGKVIYTFTDAYLRYGTVRKLMKADEILAGQGYGLVIWDAYRPVYAQARLWEVYPDPAYVSRPGTGIQSHCRGLAVDVTLYDLETGEKLEMPTGFDSFTSLADRDYGDCTAAAAQNARLLEKTLSDVGLKPYSAEWWHFSDKKNYDIEYEFDPANPEGSS